MRKAPACAILERMAPSIQKFRELVLQLLYSRGFEASDIEGMVPLLMNQLTVPKRGAVQAQARAELIWEKREELDEKVNACLIEYEEDRILRVERAILRLGTFELLEQIVPPKVAIVEAIRLARKFATKESGALVNAILDAIYKSSQENESAPVPEEPVPC